MNTLLTLLLLAAVPQEAEAPEAEAPAAQEEAAPVEEPETKLEATTTGYLDTRFTGSHVSPGGLVPATGVPALTNLSEGNMEVKLRYGPRLSAGADLSLFWQWAGLFRSVDTQGEEVALAEQDVPLYRPSAVVSELFAAWEAAPHLNLTLGKKRVVWGSGMAFNPTDLLNPPKDPTDPAGQRAGAWLARVELPFEHFSVSLVGAAKVLRQYAGLPTSVLVYPDYPTAEAVGNPALDDRDKEAHWAAAARLYALVADTDVTLTYHFTHLYNDAFREKSRVGLSLSRVFDATEVHLEALAQTGSSRMYAAPACTPSPEALLGARCPAPRPCPARTWTTAACAPRCWWEPAISSRTTPRCRPSTTSTERATAPASSPTTWGCWARDGGCWRSSRPSRPRRSPPASAPPAPPRTPARRRSSPSSRCAATTSSCSTASPRWRTTSSSAPRRW
jgi:hypothetical protein